MKHVYDKNYNMFWKKAHNKEFKCKRNIQFDKARTLTVKYYGNKLKVGWECNW